MNRMNEGKVVSLVVTKDMIESNSILDVAKAIYKFEELGFDAFQKVAVVFHGYDSTSVEVWEMPEVRKWVNRLVNKIPYLFYYIEQEYFQTQQTLMLCLCDYESIYAGDRKSPEEWGEEMVPVDELPKHGMKIHVHRKSMLEMFSEIRKHAKVIKKGSNATKLISEMSKRYGVSAD